MIRKHLGKNLRKLRKERKVNGKELTQNALAEFLSVSPRYYQTLERGNGWPSAEVIERIAKFYSITYGEVFDTPISPRTLLLEAALMVKDSDIPVAIKKLSRLL